MTPKNTALRKELAPPSPREIDFLVARFEKLRDEAELADEAYENAKAELIELVQELGSVPAGAESSIRLEGLTTVLTVTTGSTIALKDTEVLELWSAMNANQQPDLFHSMFGTRTKYELRKGAENELRTAQLPQRMFEKFMKLYARCFDVKKKSPSLKVERIGEAKKKKGGR